MNLNKLKLITALGLSVCALTGVAYDPANDPASAYSLHPDSQWSLKGLQISGMTQQFNTSPSGQFTFSAEDSFTESFYSPRAKENFRRYMNGQEPLRPDEVFIDPTLGFGLGGSTGFRTGLDFSASYRETGLWTTGQGISQFTGSPLLIDDVNTDQNIEGSWEGVQCTDVDPNSLTAAAAQLDWGQCFANRKSYAIDPSLPQKELLENDMNICSCLRNWDKMPAVKEIMRGNVAEERSKSVPKAELDDIMNGIFLQSYEVLGDAELAKRYAHNLFDKKQIELTLNSKLLRDDGPFDLNVCISPREFILQNQKPSQGIRELLTGNYKDSEWNYKNLEAEYFQLMKLSPADRESKKEQIVFLKEKLKFLNRNPLIKYSLGSAEAGAHKSDIFNVMKMQTDPSCAIISSECSKKYKAALSEIFKKPDVLKMVRKEAKVDHENRAKRKQSGDVLSERKQELSQRNIVNEFMETYRLKSPDTCESNKVNGIGCLEIYSGYCRIVDKYKDDINGLPSQSIDPDIYNDLDEDLRDDFNVDIASNEEYQRMNAEACEVQNGKKHGSNFQLPSANFEQFVKSYCQAGSKPNCPKNGKISSYEDLVKLRQLWLEAYPPGAERAVASNRRGVRGHGKFDLSALQAHAQNGETVGQASTQEAASVASNDHNSAIDEDTNAAAFVKAVASRGKSLLGAKADTAVNQLKEAEKPFLASFGQAVANTMSQTGFSDLPSYDDTPVYANSFISPQIAETPAVVDTPKIENMSSESRQELLEDWQREYDEWKKSKGDDMSPADIAKENALKQEIATLRALLAQQQEMSEQQFKLLNDALANRSKSSDLPKVEDQQRPQDVKKSQSQFASAARTISSDDEVEAIRAPASVKETKFNTAGSNGGGISSSSSNRKSSSSDSSSDSVAREEAKLVNMRRHTDGSITIESTNANSSAPNAITVPVSDEQYKILQTNPAGLNLSQIEKNIPKDQIEKLEKRGEIIILLKNGSNPPFEVKVEKKDNRLVYSLKDKNGKDQIPVRRVYTRQALELELKAER